MIKIESAVDYRRNPLLKAECENCTIAGQLQANCGWCEHVDYVHTSDAQIQLCKLKKCKFEPWRGWEDCYRICSVDFDGGRP